MCTDYHDVQLFVATSASDNFFKVLWNTTLKDELDKAVQEGYAKDYEELILKNRSAEMLVVHPTSSLECSLFPLLERIIPKSSSPFHLYVNCFTDRQSRMLCTHHKMEICQ